MKRFLTLLALVAISICSYAYDFEEGGIYYDITSSTTTSVTFKDTNYNSYSGIVVIPSDVTHNGTTYTVTSIGNRTFCGCEELPYVIIPISVTSIGDFAFSSCSSLTSITIPNSVTSIGDSAFNGCKGLTSVTIPNSVSSIGNWAFAGCSSLTSITIPNSVTSIGDSAFNGCKGLTSVTIPNSVTSIGTHAFNGCKGLTSVTIPNSVTSIGSSAFENCSGLTSITIPNSVTSIGVYAFAYCSGLTSVIIPNSVTNIGISPFINCSSLTSLSVEDNNPNYDSRSNCNAIIEKSTNTLVSGCKNTIIPYSVTSIGNWAFAGCSSLTSITIPNSVTSIGYSAFYNCYSLTSITIPNSVTSIGESAFNGCKGLTSVTIPNSVTSIGYSAFYNCYSLTSLTLPDSLTIITMYMLANCSGLTSITIPKSVTSIERRAFYNCSNLKSVINRAKKPQTIYDETFSYFGTLHVVKGYKDVYRNSNYWKNFTIVDDVVGVLVEGFIIDVDNQHFDINVGGLRANATPTNNDADDWSVTWSTTTPSIMMVVPKTGDFMGLTDGVGELVATANDGSGVVAKAKVYFGTAQPDAIESVRLQDINDNKVYNLNGTRIDSDNLPAGIYIKNGKKVVVR